MVLISFEDFMSEKVSIDIGNSYIGGEGDLVNVMVGKGKYHKTGISIEGSKILKKIPTLEQLMAEYDESEHKALEKHYKSILNVYAGRLATSIDNFEKSLNDIVVSIEKDMKDL
jgi:diphthamide synthase subunit DPH2